PPGSGKTVLLRSWIGQAGLADCAAWVAAGRGERDPQRFWLSVLAALRAIAAGAGVGGGGAAAAGGGGGGGTAGGLRGPAPRGWGRGEGVVGDRARVDEGLWLVVDDVHELGAEALAQLELLIMRAPPELRFVLAARHDVRLGLHRLRLEGELAAIGFMAGRNV